jgi:hypothetical protein
VFAPKWWRYVSALRGIVNPLIDKRQERDARTQALLKDVDDRATASPAPNADATPDERPLNAAD